MYVKVWFAWWLDWEFAFTFWDFWQILIKFYTWHFCFKRSLSFTMLVWCNIWNRVILEKLIIPQLLEQFCVFYGICRSIMVFTTACYGSCLLPDKTCPHHLSMFLSGLFKYYPLPKHSFSYMFSHQSTVYIYLFSPCISHAPPTSFFLVRLS